MVRSAKASGRRSAATTRKAKGRPAAKAKQSVQPARRVKRSTALEFELREARKQQSATADIFAFQLAVWCSMRSSAGRCICARRLSDS